MGDLSGRTPSATLLVVVGLAAEARIARGPGIVVVAGGGDRAGLRRKLDALDPATLAGVISFGLAGGLDPGLRVGEVVVSTSIVDTSAYSSPNTGPSAGSDEIVGTWQRLLGDVRLGRIAGSDVPLATVAAKATLGARTGAMAVDMESHVAAAFAARHALPFAALRVISDAAGHALPPAASLAMRPDGGIDLAAVLASLARQPWQLAGLLATARDAAVALRRLRRVRGLLGLRLGLHL